MWSALRATLPGQPSRWSFLLGKIAVNSDEQNKEYAKRFAQALPKTLTEPAPVPIQELNGRVSGCSGE